MTSPAWCVVEAPGASVVCLQACHTHHTFTHDTSTHPPCPASCRQAPVPNTPSNHDHKRYHRHDEVDVQWVDSRPSEKRPAPLTLSQRISSSTSSSSRPSLPRRCVVVRDLRHPHKLTRTTDRSGQGQDCFGKGLGAVITEAHLLGQDLTG